MDGVGRVAFGQEPERAPERAPPANSDFDFDRLAANVLLTVQALQALHSAFDRKFTRK